MRLRRDAAGMAKAEKELKPNYKYFGYGYFNNVKEAIPNVPLVFYPFHIMVTVGGWLLIFLLAAVLIAFKKREWLSIKWKNISLFPTLALLTIPLTYICSQCGWIVAELGRQPWAIQDIMPVQAAVSSLSVGQIVTTFIIFGILFTVLLCAEISIMVRQIKKGPEA
jgi:cytochrome d ubiquinol oxidase subunit I